MQDMIFLFVSQIKFEFETLNLKTCFLWLRQLRRVRRSLDIESVKTLVHAFVTSRVDYCNSVLSSAPKKARDKLQLVHNAAARLVTGPANNMSVVCLG